MEDNDQKYYHFNMVSTLLMSGENYDLIEAAPLNIEEQITNKIK